MSIERAFHSMLSPAGPQAALIARLWWAMFWTTSVVFAVVMALFLIAAFVRRKGDRAAIPAPRLTTAVSTGVAVTVLILIAFLAASVSTGRAAASTPQENAVAIELIGHQW